MKRALGTIAKAAAAAATATVLLASCTNARNEGESANSVPLPDDMPLCSEQFQQGKTIDEADFGKACRTDDDQLEVPRFVRLSCADDSTLVWNSFAWGYVGQPMQLFDPSAEVRIPTDEALACREDVGTSLPGAPAP